jgi:hypothetical protein
VTTATKKARLFRALCRRWLTPLEAVAECGIFSLSQRCGDFRREGHTVLDKWVHLPSGSRVKAYRITRPTSWTA